MRAEAKSWALQTLTIFVMGSSAEELDEVPLDEVFSPEEVFALEEVPAEELSPEEELPSAEEVFSLVVAEFDEGVFETLTGVEEITLELSVAELERDSELFIELEEPPPHPERTRAAPVNRSKKTCFFIKCLTIGFSIKGKNGKKSPYGRFLCSGHIKVYHAPMEKYQDLNAAAITRWINDGWEWGKPIDHNTFLKAQAGDWDVVLTPTKKVPHAWFPSFPGKQVLGLASGGGQQMPIFAALGGICTVFDYTPAQLKSEKMVAEREGYSIRIIQGDMSQPLPFKDEEFDLIFFPVSNVYIAEAKPVFKECFRVLKKGGRLISGLDNGTNFITDDNEKEIINHFPFDPLHNPEQMAQLQASDSGVQFSHTLEEQIGGQLEAGFVLKELYEDTNGSGRLHDLNIPTFFATLAEKPGPISFPKEAPLKKVKG